MADQKSVHDKPESCICGECGADISIEDKYCPYCGADVSEIEESKNEELTKKRYPALRTIAGIYQVFAYLWLLLSVIGGLIALAKIERLGILLLLLLSVGGTIAFITSFAMAESIKVFIDIEENTRKMVELQSKKIEEQK